MGFADHFSSIAAAYAAYRPTYPDSLFAWLAEKALNRNQAWDCACGNGQASVGLARYFEHVTATDASAEQIAAATPHVKIEYRVAPAENSGLAPQSADLVTAGQAVHWFHFDKFYAEVRRVLKPRGLLAVWSYDWLQMDDDRLEKCVSHFCGTTVGPYWPSEIDYIRTRYSTIPFPFDEIPVPHFSMETSLNLAEVLGHFRSWSATMHYVKAHGADPVAEVEKELTPLWGDPSMRRPVKWPFYMRAGYT